LQQRVLQLQGACNEADARAGDELHVALVMEMMMMMMMMMIMMMVMMMMMMVMMMMMAILMISCMQLVV
jgi:hypothetical protein